MKCVLFHILLSHTWDVLSLYFEQHTSLCTSVSMPNVKMVYTAHVVSVVFQVTGEGANRCVKLVKGK